MVSLVGKVALVTGASRGIGRGIAVGLGEAGATVFVTGRTAAEGAHPLPGTLPETARLIEAAGGRAIPILCDHRDDGQVARVFEIIDRDAGRLDLLVNNATAIPSLDQIFNERPFWEVGSKLWDDLFDVGLRSHFIAAQHAVPLMIASGGGLIVNVSSAGAGAKIGVVPYGVAKAALDHMTGEMATELSPEGVTVVSVWPPPTRTPGMLASAGAGDDIARWAPPEFTGRVIAALAAEPGVMARSGQVLRIRDLAREWGLPEQ